MGSGQMGGVLHYLRGLFCAPPVAQTDRDLLHAFATRRDEAAFAALVERHGPLVWDVCRRLLRDEHDAEDAFQASFLVLARKAGALPWREDVGNWMYAVALRVARKARARSARRRQVEGEVVTMERPAANPEADGETSAIVAEEVGRLPEKYRRPVVLCCLQGKSYGEAAQLLGWPEGTVSGRLARAREFLRRRLVRRGLALPAAGLAGLLAADAVAALPAALAGATVRAALTFAAGPGLTSGAAALAEEGLRAMSLMKWKVGAALLVALAVIGTGLGVWARGRGEPAPVAGPPPAEPPKDVVAEKTRLPAAWARRWVADPFAGAQAIEVEHHAQPGGGSRTYHIKDARTVAAVAKAARITGIRNDMFVGCIPTTELAVRRRDGSSFRASFAGGDSVSCDTGLFTLDDGFFTALGRAVSDANNASVNLREFLPAPPVADNKPPPATVKSLAAGFTALEVTYLLSGRLHVTRIADEKALDALHRSLVVLKTEGLTTERAESRHMTIVCKDGASFYLHIQSRDVIFDFHVGKFTVAPAFFNALNAEVSRRAGLVIDVTAEKNALPERLERRGREFRALVGDVRLLRRTVKRDGKEETIVIDDPKEVEQMVRQLGLVEVPPHNLNLPKWDRLIELTMKDGKKVTLTFLHPGQNSEEAEALAAMPTLSQLVDVSGFGQVWLDGQWWGRFDDLNFEHQRKAKERRDRETTRLVCRDLPAFCKLVVGVDAHYSETGGKPETEAALPAEAVPAILALLAPARFERLDWTEERWQKELTDLDERGAGELDLAPGLGFSLPLVVSGDKEMLIPLCGKLTFADSPIARLQKAVNAKEPDKVGLVPRPSGR
jgi:RNA polymerase sigma factor (sigma-70 family)